MVVLLIDDDPNDLALFAAAVDYTDLPLWVQTVRQLEAAIAYLEGTGKYADRCLHPEPDLVLVDLRLGGGDGFDFLRWWAASPRFRRVPVVTYTGSDYQADLDLARQLGATAHLQKPFTFEALKATVRKVHTLGRQLAAGANPEQPLDWAV